jgi:hypothetical protein
MKYYTVTLRLSGALADAVAVEWSDQAAPVDSGRGWEPCIRQADGAWRFSSADLGRAEQPHRRGPGLFPDLAIRYRLSPSAPWSAASAARKEIAIAETEEFDAAALDPARIVLRAALLSAPALLGAGQVGAAVSVDPGRWSGLPAPSLAFQWRRDGTAIVGATARAYTPVAADDGRRLSCAVTAANAAGAVAAVTPELRIAYAPPQAKAATLPDLVLDEGSGPQRVEMADDFDGQGLTFAATGATIDARTGTLTIPTTRPASGLGIVVTATNSGGSASTTLPVTVEATPGETLGADDVTIVRSDWRPASQSVTFTPVVRFPGLSGASIGAIQWTAETQFAANSAWHPCVARAGEAGAYDLRATGDPLPAGTVDPSLFSNATAADVARRSRLRFRWRLAQAETWSEPSGVFVAPPPPASEGPWPTIGATALARAREIQNPESFRYSSTLAAGYRDAFGQHCIFTIALAAYSNVSTVLGGLTPRQALKNVLSYWVAGDNAPCAFGGVRGQHEFAFVTAVAMAKLIPSVWDALTAVERNRLDLVMKGQLVSYVWQMSDNNPYVRAGVSSQERTIRGEDWGRGRAPNYSLPAAIGPSVIAAYMGGAAATNAFLAGFNRAAFARQISEAGGLTELWDTFRQDWTGGRTGNGPNATELQAALRSATGGPFTYLGFTLAQPNEIFLNRINNMWGATIAAGISPRTGNSSGSLVAVPGTIGIFEPASLQGAPRPTGGRGGFVGRITNEAAWAGLPNAGQVGMALELNTTDGGYSLSGSAAAGGGPRSSMHYSFKGAMVALTGCATMAAYGALDRTTVLPALQRQARGVADLKYRVQHGHRNVANGGRLYITNANEDMIASNLGGWRLDSLFGIHDDVIARWAGI